MPFANVERVPGGYVVSRFFAVQAAAQRGMDLLLSVREEAFDPVAPPLVAPQIGGLISEPIGQYLGGPEGAKIGYCVGSTTGGLVDVSDVYRAQPANPVRQDTGD